MLRTALALLAVTMLGAVAFATGVKKHHSGHAMIAPKLRVDGTHQLAKDGKDTVSADVKTAKIAAVHVKHETKGDIAVKKYKTHKKMALIDVPPADAIPTAEGEQDAVWIGYSFIDDDGNEDYYWFPVDDILDGDSGAVEYAPAS